MRQAHGMTANFAAWFTTSRDPRDRTPAESAVPAVDWHAVRFADRACCCAAKPAVVVIMLPAPGREHATDLLLCGHHFRASSEMLATAGVPVFDAADRQVTRATEAVR
jgi:hypothetical protein